MKYQRKPPVVEAIRYEGRVPGDLKCSAVCYKGEGDVLHIEFYGGTLLHLLLAEVGDWIVVDRRGRPSVYRDDEFRELFEVPAGDGPKETA